MSTQSTRAANVGPEPEPGPPWEPIPPNAKGLSGWAIRAHTDRGLQATELTTICTIIVSAPGFYEVYGVTPQGGTFVDASIGGTLAEAIADAEATLRASGWTWTQHTTH